MIAFLWITRLVAISFFLVAFGWAVYKFNVTGDGRWWLTIIFAPLFAAMIGVQTSLLIRYARH